MANIQLLSVVVTIWGGNASFFNTSSTAQTRIDGESYVFVDIKTL